MKTKTILLLISILFASNAFSQKDDGKNNGHGLGRQTVHGLGRQTVYGLGGQSVQSDASGNRNQKLKSIGDANKNQAKIQQNNGTYFLGGNYSAEYNYVKSKIRHSKDSVFYLNVTKRNGWPEGIGKPLKREELSHIPVYYVLSNKNDAGNWTFMRAYDAYGNLTTNHSWGAYIMNPNDEYDTGANAEWVEKLKTVCQWEYIGDSEGNEVIQERALDKDRNVIFCYNIVKVKENKNDGSTIYSGSYTDAFALPIFMRTDSTGNYQGQANFVQVKRDKRGYETLFAFTDETGHIRLNKDGAYQTSKEYNENGVQIREASLDLAGNQMIDFYGNCGWKEVVDEYGNRIKVIYFGTENEPIRMPGTRGSNKVFGYEFTYDKYHREQERWYLDSLGNRDVNEYGVYHIVCEYNNYGERTLFSHYDRQGNLIGSDEYGIAQVVTDYDDKGNLLFLEWRNKDGMPVNGYGNYCRRVLTYDKNGNSLSQVDYIKDKNDSITVSFKYVNDSLGNEIRYWYTDEGYYRVDSVDAKGRATLEAWYDLNNKPIARHTDEIEAWHRHVTTYDDENNTKVEEWLDIDGKPYANTEYSLSNKYNLSIDEKNMTNNILTNTQYLKPFGLAQKFQKEFDDEGNIIAQWDITPYGEQARVGWWNNLHYKCKVNYTMYGKMMDMRGVNEFEEPSYLVSLNDDGEVYHYNDMDTYYDEHMQIIPTDSMASFKEKLPKVFCIEVTDTTIAYPLGLKNGDIILSYGDWATSENLRSNLDYFYLETILKNGSTKKIRVLRHNILDKTSSIFVYNLPEGKPSELGFYPHQICYTKKEADRLRDACHRYNFTYGSDVVTGSKQALMGVQLKGGLVQTRFYHFDMYDYKDPGFLLYASEKYSKGHDTWSVMYDDITTWRKRDMFNSKYSVDTELYLTQDMKSLKKLSKSSKGNRGLRIIPIYVTDEVYANILSYYNTIDELPKQTITSKEKAISVIKEKQVVGKWHTVIELNEGTVDFTLDLDKKNLANMVMSLSFGGEISDGITLKLKASVTNSGRWSLQGNELCLDMKNESRQMNLDGIEIECADESRRKELMEQVARHESEFLEMIASNGLGNIQLNSMHIESISKTEFRFMIGNDIITFKRIK